jgi:hypothetical protein
VIEPAGRGSGPGGFSSPKRKGIGEREFSVRRSRIRPVFAEVFGNLLAD